MPNRYANLTPSAKISQEYTKITEGFDKVQSEMDQRIAKDNDLQSQITNEQQQRIAADQAHQNSTAAHPAEHITYSGKVSGASNIKQAADRLNDRIDNIVAQGGSDNTEVVDARMGADGVARPTLGTLVREIHAQQIDSARQAVTLKHGQNIVTTDQASPAEIIVRGRTLVNLLGSVGNCSDLSKFSQVDSYGNLLFEIDTSDSFAGTTSFKSVGAAYSQTLVLPLNLKAGKYYLVGCYIKTNVDTGYISLSPDSGGELNLDNREAVAASTNWRYWHLKINPDTDGWYFKALKGYGDDESAFMSIDAISVYEVTAEEYAKIGVDPEWSGDKLAEKFPYVDGIQHVVNPAITKFGRTTENLQLELGENATPFTPRNDDYIYAECVLRSLPNGTKDLLDVSSKKVVRFISDEIVLNGTLEWYYSSDVGNYYQIELQNFFNNIIKPSVAGWAIAISDDGNFAAVSDFAPSRSVNTNAAGTLFVRIEKSKIDAMQGGNTIAKAKAYLDQFPITLIYQLSNPVTEEVSVEGAISLHDGTNIIDVSEGVILREKFDPLYHPDDRAYFVNVAIFAGTELNHKADRIIAIYRNNILDTKWVIVTGPVAHGRQYAFIYDKDFDPEAEYSVTYLVLDKYALTANVTDVTAQYNTNQKTVVDALTRDMADAKTEISIHDRILAELISRLVALEEG